MDITGDPKHECIQRLMLRLRHEGYLKDGAHNYNGAWGKVSDWIDIEFDVDWDT